MSYPGTLFIEATANPFYQEIGGVLTGCKSISEFKECSEVRDKETKRTKETKETKGTTTKSAIIFLCYLCVSVVFFKTLGL